MACERHDPRNSVAGAKGPQEEKKGGRALIDAGVETSTSIIKHLKVRVCAPGGIGGQGGEMLSMKHSAITLKSPDAVRIYLPKRYWVPKYKHSEASEPTQLPKRHARTSLSCRPVGSIRPAGSK